MGNTGVCVGIFSSVPCAQLNAEDHGATRLKGNSCRVRKRAEDKVSAGLGILLLSQAPTVRIGEQENSTLSLKKNVSPNSS